MAHRSLGTKIDTGEEVAIKLEHVSIEPSLLELEADAYRSLSGGVGIPHVHDYLFECEYKAMVCVRPGARANPMKTCMCLQRLDLYWTL